MEAVLWGQDLAGWRGGDTGWEPRSGSYAHHGQLQQGRKRLGSLPRPLFTLSLIPAAQWPQEIESWAGNRAGNRQQQSRSPACV